MARGATHPRVVMGRRARHPRERINAKREGSNAKREWQRIRARWQGEGRLGPPPDHLSAGFSQIENRHARKQRTAAPLR